MLKSIVLCVFLWHEMCECSHHAKTFLTDSSIPNFPEIVSPKIDHTEMHSDNQETAPRRNYGDTSHTIRAPRHVCPTGQMEPTVNYNINATHQMFYVNGPLLGKTSVDHNLNSSNNVFREDYLLTNGIGAHKVHKRGLKWNKARQMCVDEGGHLAVIRSVPEENIVLKMMTDLSVDSAWIGFHDLFEEGDWNTVLDESLSKNGWAHWSSKYVPNPNNGYGGLGPQNCAQLLTDGGGMDDYQCDYAQAFVCKISTI